MKRKSQTGGASADADDQAAVNVDGTINVLVAARLGDDLSEQLKVRCAQGIRSVVIADTLR